MYVEDVEDTIINLRVHSTVYRINVEDVEDFQMYMDLFKEDDPDKYKSWFELGRILAWRLWMIRRLRVRWIKLRRTRRWPECTKTPKSVTGK